MATRTHRLPRAFTRDDGRERIAIPFWRGVLFALGSVAVALPATFAAMIVLMVVAVLATGDMPSTTPGHPLLAVSEVLFYAVVGFLARYGLRPKEIPAFRKLTRSDVRVILIGVGALFAIRVGMAIQLVITNQTKHVQAGFEHFDVTSKVPGMTSVSVAFAVLSLVIVAPLVEEILFRGLLFGALAPRLGVLASALVTALLFGAIHGDPILFPTLAALGFVTALAYAATGNLWTAITLHALNNSLGAIFLVTTSLSKQ